MTRQDYVAIAGAIRDARRETFTEDPETLAAIDRVTRKIAYVMSADNPRFNAQRFMDATEV